MGSKETALNTASEDSPCSCVSSSFPVDNDVLASKHVDLDENNDDNSRNDSKVVVAAEFEAATDKSIPDEIEREGVEEGNSGLLVKVENGGDDVEMREKVVEGDEDAVGEGDFADPVEKLGVDFDVGGGEVVDGEGGEAVVEVEGKELKEDGVKVIEPDVEEDSVVESVEVDVASPRTVVIGEPEESIDVVSNSGMEVVEAKPEELEVIDLGESNKTELEEVKGDSVVDSIQADEVDSGVIVVVEAKENGDREVEEGEVVDETVKSNDDRSHLDPQTNSLVDGISEESTLLESDEPKPVPNIQEIRQVEDEKADIHPKDSISDGDTENGGDDVKIREKIVEGDEDVVGKGLEGEFADPVEKLGINLDEEVEVEGKELKEDDIKAIEQVTDLGDGKSTIQVDVGNPGVVLGEQEESIDVVSKSDKEVVVEGHEAEPEKLEVVDLGESNKVEQEEVKGVFVVDSMHADVVDSGAIVGETKENVGRKIEEGEVLLESVIVATEDVVSKSDEDVVVELNEAELEKLEVVDLGEFNKTEQEEVKLTPEGNSVVDSVTVDVVDSGVIVGETKENGGREVEEGEVPLESVSVATENGNINEEDVGVDIVEPENIDVGNEKEESLDAGAVTHLDNGFQNPLISNDPVNGYVENGTATENGNGKEEDVEVDLQNTERASGNTVDIVEPENLDVGNEKDKSLDAGGVTDLENGYVENGIAANVQIDGEVKFVDETVKNNDDHSDLHLQTNRLVDGISEESKPVPNIQEIRQVEDEKAEIHRRDSMSDGDTEDMIFGSSEAAKKFIEELERESGDGQIVRDSDSDSDSEEEGETDDEGDGKQLFDPAALVALLKAARSADPSGGNLTLSMDHPAGLGSSLQSSRVSARPTRPTLFGTLATANGGELEENLTQEEKKKLEKLQEIRVKFLRLVRRLGLTLEEPVAAQVLYQLAVLGGRRGTQTYSLDAAKKAALQLEGGEKDSLDFNINILVLGKSGVGKSATVNSLLGEDNAAVDAFGAGTASAVEIRGSVEGVKIRIVDTPGLKPSVMEQGINRRLLSSVKKLTKRNPTDVLLYVDRLDAESRDLNDVPLLKTVTDTLGSTVWRNAVVTLTHGASAPPEGPLGSCINYETFVSRRSRFVQQCIGHAVGDLRMMSPSLMNPVTLVENHSSCRKNIVGEKILPNGQRWRAQLLLLCYSMKILSEANSVSKPPEPFDHRRLFGLRARTPALPYMLSSILQSHPHPKLVSDQGFDSDIDLDEFSDSDQEEEDEYDQLPPFKPLRKAQVAKLSKEQRKAYYEEYDYREKLLQKKQWREELRRMREMKKRGKDGVNVTEYGFTEGDDSASGGSGLVSVPLPDPALPPSFDGDNPAYRYRSLEPGSRFLARPTLDSHGWDHDCGYEGVLVDHALDIANRLAAAYTVQVRKDKKDFGIHFDSSVAAKQGEKTSHMAGFDIQAIGRQLAYILRAETRTKSFKKNKLTSGVSLTFVGENVVPGVKVEDEIKLGKRYSVLGSGGAVRCKEEAAYGANLEVQRKEVGCPVGQVQSTVGVSVVRWRGDLTLGFNGLAHFSLGRNSKVEVQAGVSNKRSGQITVKTSSSEYLSLALAAILPAAVSLYRKFFPGGGDDYAIY